jgi:hypothetical protein
MSGTSGASEVSNTQEQLIGQVRNVVEVMGAAIESLYGKALSVEDTGLFFFDDIDPNDIDDDDGFVFSTTEIQEAAREYLGDVLSIEGMWQGGSKEDAEYRGCEVLITYGGPDIRLDTSTGLVTGRWGGDEVTRSVDSSVCDYYDQMMEG